MICFYHSADFDGICSGAIVKQKYPDCYLYGINYGQPFPWEMIDEHDTVIMCDFSLQPIEDMHRLQESCKKFIWIDHHISAIKEAEETGLSFGGLQEDGWAACELTWRYFYPDKPTPQAITYIGRYDVWDHSDSKTLPFQYGMRSFPQKETRPYNMEFWEELFFGNSWEMDKIIIKGDIILDYIKSDYESYVKSYSFVTEFEGYKALACNRGMTGSKLFESIYAQDELYDIMIVFTKLAHDPSMWTISLYTESDDIDCSVLAKKYGGGGHNKAAGFQCDTLFLLDNIITEEFRPRNKEEKMWRKEQ